MRYGILRRLRKGDRLCLWPTFRCQLDCSHCGPLLVAGGMKRNKLGYELTVDEFIDVVDQFIERHETQEVLISGGEPSLYNGIGELIERIIHDHRLCCTVFTNGMSDRLAQVRTHDRLRLVVNYHHHTDREVFLANLSRFRDAHAHVQLKELGCAYIDETETVKKVYGREFIYDDDCNARWQIANDGTVHPHFLLMMRHLSGDGSWMKMLNAHHRAGCTREDWHEH